MGKYLLLWEVDRARIPIDPKERGAGWGMLMAMVRQDKEKGRRIGEHLLAKQTDMQLLKELR